MIPDPDLSWRTGPSPRGPKATTSTSSAWWSQSWGSLDRKHHDLLLYGKGIANQRTEVRFRNRYGRVRRYNARYEGVIPYLQRRHSESDSDAVRAQIEGYMREVPCSACHGARLNPLSLAVTVDGRTIDEVCGLSIRDSASALASLELSERDQAIAGQVLRRSTPAQVPVRCRLEY